MSTEIITNPSIEQQLEDAEADLNYYEQRIKKWEAQHVDTAPNSADAQRIEQRLAHLDSERTETVVELRRLRQLWAQEQQRSLDFAVRVTNKTPTGTPVIYRTHGGETRTGRFTGGVSMNGVSVNGVTDDELGVGQNATRFEVSIDGRVGSTVWVEELYRRDA